MNYTFGYKQEKLLFRSGTARARAGNPEGLGLVIHQAKSALDIPRLGDVPE